MNERSKTLSLMALKERARMALTLGEVREVAVQKAEAARTAERLAAALAERRVSQGAVQSMATLRAERGMVGQILTEIDRQCAREAALAQALAEAQAKLAKEEHRLSLLTDKAKAARQGEAEARQALRDAAMPPRRR
ncbi:hypothetical protein [Paragemmobacter straminiformis]|uniref:Uncharacterized protein n=1 Tax=Paragemmobacter straminiformis TaxID=2045119 RepID=A0A842I5X3_9RHOB|nr:hypothetical protein [Gemmobacter straminiformis]MBC2834777.1 hypothetical protein [Gemmobacter straminiformis]